MRGWHVDTQPALERCAETGKVQYLSVADAVKAARNREQSGPARVSIFRCLHCGQLHVGRDRRSGVR